MRKLTSTDWDNIQKNQPSRYFVHNLVDGTLRVTFDSEIFVTERGKEDILGNVWQKEWDKHEVKALINGEPKIYSLGAGSWSQMRTLIAVCKQNNIKPEDLPGCVFDFTKTGDWDWEVKYIGKSDDVGSTDNAIEIKENLLKDATEAIEDIKKTSPALIKDGITKPEFIKIMQIKAKIKSTDMEKVIPGLIENKVLMLDGDKLHVL